jgi:hypothetical protein
VTTPWKLIVVGQQAERVVVVQDPKGAFAVRRTASKDNPEALQGFHAEDVLFLMDEASGIPDIVFEVGAQGSGDAYRDQTVIKQRCNLLPIKAAKFVTSDGKPKLRLRMRCGCSGPKSGPPIFHLGSSSRGRRGDGVAARHVRLKSLGCGHPQLP